MNYVRLGKSGLNISAIGLGTMQAGDQSWGRDVSEAECIRGIVRARELGVNFVDTAEAYGNGHSEEVVGKAIRESGRDDFVVATKVSGGVFTNCHLRYDDVIRACDASMRRLGIDQIDLYQVHFPNPWEQVPLKETMRAMEKLHSEGKVRAVGVSNFAVRDLKEAQAFLGSTCIASNQVQYSLLHREIEEEVIPYCRKEDITVIAWSPLAKGALTGKYTLTNRPSDQIRAEHTIFSDRNLPHVLRLVSKLIEIGEGLGKTPSQVALNWLTRNGGVVPIPGAKRPQQTEENAGAVGWKLSSYKLKEIQEVLDGLLLDYF